MGNICGAPGRHNDPYVGTTLDKNYDKKKKGNKGGKGLDNSVKSISEPQAIMGFDNNKKEKQFSTAEAFNAGAAPPNGTAPNAAQAEADKKKKDEDAAAAAAQAEAEKKKKEAADAAAAAAAAEAKTKKEAEEAE